MAQVVTPSSPAADDPLPLSGEARKRPRGNIRWVICGLLLLATTINYMDRQIIGILKPELQKNLGWSEIDYANIVFAFQLCYAIGQFGAGRMIDFFGVRIGYAVSVVGWSVAAMAHGVARSVIGFQLARGALGIFEGGNFPAAIKSVSEWFPKRERALATGIFNSGSNIGAMVTPLIVPWITIQYGWRAAFYFTGALGFIWLVAWLLMYERPRRHKRLSAEELAYIEDNDTGVASAELVTEPSLPLTNLLARRTTMAYVLATLLTSPVWWFYLFWIPGFLSQKFSLNLSQIGWPVATIYLMADVGSIGGGWISSYLIKRGWSINAGRKTAMLICALAVVPIFFASIVTDKWTAVFLIGLAAAAHQGWSANLYTFGSDTTPRGSVSSLVGLGGLAGGLASMGVAKLVGYVLHTTSNNYFILFAGASVMYLVALLVIQILVPRISETTPTRDGDAATA
ncbi:MAG TPA: MFS transporter [Tepidisphaeraceae bacterium]|jgi:ACS family hexuronate transporter-like MFS transporter